MSFDSFNLPILIVLAIVLLLFGSTQIPKLARSLGSARSEFKKGLAEVQGTTDAEAHADAPVGGQA